MLGKEEHESLVGDLDERYTQLASLYGRQAANRFYWRETLAAVGLHSTHTRTPGAYPRGDSKLRHVLTDLGYALRTLRRAPTHVIICVLTLGLALGSMTAVISVVNPLLIQPLPYPDAHRLGIIRESGRDGPISRLGYATYADIAASVKSIDAAAVGFWQPTLSGADDAERVSGLRVSANYFRVLGIAPALGSDFQTEQDVPGATPVVMLSNALWQRRFGGDPSIINKPIDIEGVSHIVAGVMPASYDDVLEPSAQIWRVLRYASDQPYACRTCRHLRMVARVNGDVPMQTVALEVDITLRRLGEAYPREYVAPGGTLVELREIVVANFRPILLAIFGAIGLILLLAVVNVANLQLTRTMRRTEEFAVRAALGAGRLQVARQLFAEALVIVPLSAALAAIVAYTATPLIVSQLPPGIPRLSAISVDGTVVLSTVVLAAVTVIVVGLLPAWRMDSGSLADALRVGRGTAAARHTARATLVVVQVAVAFVLVTGAGLLGRSLMQLLSVNTGFASSGLLTMSIQATGARYSTSAEVWAWHDAALAKVRGIPGVVSAGLSNQLPLSGNLDKYSINAEDRPLANPQLAPDADRYTVSPGYAETMRLRLVRGKLLDEADNRDSTAQVVMISTSLARRIWGTDDVLGKRIRAGGSTSPWREVVGVVGDVRHQGLNESEPMQFYVPARQWQFADDILSLVVRTSADPASMTNTIVSAVKSVDPLQPVMNVATMDQLVMRSTGQRRLALVLFASLGLIAVILAGAGLYGVLAGAVSDRTREIGIRSAIGASSRNIVTLVTRQAMLLVAIGSAFGIAGSIVVGRYLQSLLFQVAPTDISTFLGAAGIALIMGLVAALVPTRRALRIPPVVALTS